MQEEKQQHHRLFHHKKEETPVETVVYSETVYGVDGAGKRYETTDTGGYATTLPSFEKEPKPHQRKELLGGLGTVAVGTLASYEKHQGNKDEVHKHMHKLEEEIATAVAVGGGGYTFHEHHEKKESKHGQEKADVKHLHNF